MIAALVQILHAHEWWVDDEKTCACGWLASNWISESDDLANGVDGAVKKASAEHEQHVASMIEAAGFRSAAEVEEAEKRGERLGRYSQSSLILDRVSSTSRPRASTDPLEDALHWIRYSRDESQKHIRDARDLEPVARLFNYEQMLDLLDQKERKINAITSMLSTSMILDGELIDVIPVAEVLAAIAKENSR